MDNENGYEGFARCTTTSFDEPAEPKSGFATVTTLKPSDTSMSDQRVGYDNHDPENPLASQLAWLDQQMGSGKGASASLIEQYACGSAMQPAGHIEPGNFTTPNIPNWTPPARPTRTPSGHNLISWRPEAYDDDEGISAASRSLSLPQPARNRTRPLDTEPRFAWA